MPYAGRGGAGNIQAVEEANKRIAEDLEANHGTAESSIQPTLPPDDRYARVGRGGAGNFYDPKELSEAEKAGLGDGVNSLGNGFMDASKTAAPSEPTRTFGRGGAGNFSFDSSENQERALRMKLEEEEQKKQIVKEQVQKGVEETLAMPPKARLPREEPEP